jgi:serine-type D-Ala-D-Ala carboxypeptidase/endopeptidase
VRQKRSKAARLALVAACSLAASSAGFARADEATVRDLANKFRATPHCNLAGISVGIIHNGQSSLFSSGMVRSTSGAPREIRDDDRFEVGSITKTFTAALYALALRDGKVTPQEPAQELMPRGVVLPVYRGATGQDVPITLDNLARHASGLPRSVRGWPSGMSREQMTDELKSTELLYQPGARFMYSNLGFAVLAMAMERVYGRPIDELFTALVAGPLGMSKTSVGASELSSSDVIKGYRPNGSEAPEQNPTWPAFDGSAALRSTPTDMLAFLRYNMRLGDAGTLTSVLPSLQKTERLERFGEDKRGVVEIGLAWQNATLPDGRRLIWKDGNVPGFRSFIGFTDSSPQTGVVVLTSQNGCEAVKLGRCVLETMDHARKDDYCASAGAEDDPDAGMP